MTAPTDQQLIDFVIREARLIDQQRFEEWLDLFADDGLYWMPLERARPDPRLTTSLMYEDKLLLRMRVERLKGIAHSLRAKSRCHHVLQTPQVDSRNDAANRIRRCARHPLCRNRLDEQTLYAAWATHTLAWSTAGSRSS